MVHFYRAAPQQPKNDMQEYLMYGLLAVALILGLFYLYKRSRHNKASPSSSPSSFQVSQELTGASWKFYGQPANEPDVVNGILTFGNNQGNVNVNGFLSNISYNTSSQMISGRKGQNQVNMKYRIVQEEAVDDSKKLEKVLIIDYTTSDGNYVPYKLILVTSPTTAAPTTAAPR